MYSLSFLDFFSSQIFQQILIGILIIGLLVSLFKEWLNPSVAFLICATVIVIFRIVEPHDMLLNFANSQIVTVV
ncbi:MAG: hypothetical protein NZ521_01380 [Flammeovirgaceae bacterium]|nr:hypothetical protein [Flammeovirgaceae bacterium]MDW8286598.1 hypothetical protein [Flammeovirgaceae bacterium]